MMGNVHKIPVASDHNEERGEYIESLKRRGVNELNAGHFEQAIATFRRCVQLAPLRQDLRDYLAMALDKKTPQEQDETPPAPAQVAGVEEAKVSKRRMQRSFSGRSRVRAAPDGDSELEALPGAERESRSRVQLPTWLIALTIVLSVVAVSFIWLFKQHESSVRELIARVKNLGVPENVIRAEDYYNKAYEKYLQTDYESALNFLEEAIEINPEGGNKYRALKSNVFLLVGDEKLNEKKYEQALENFKKAVDADYKSADGWFNVGLSNYQLAIQAKRRRQPAEPFYRQAVEALERARELDADHQSALRLLAEIYPKINEITEAVGIWYKVIEQMPDDSAAKKAREHLLSHGYDPEDPPAFYKLGKNSSSSESSSDD